MGWTLSGSELFAVFDADFVPAPDVLQRMVPYFADPKVGMVQARWTHLNRDESLLTRVQALFLDAHFAVESAARNFGRRFFNFNGTAGIWRRAAHRGCRRLVISTADRGPRPLVSRATGGLGVRFPGGRRSAGASCPRR